MKRLDTFYRGLSKEGRAQYCKDAKVGQAYLESFLLYRTKIAKKALMWRLAQASNGALTYEEVVHFFYLLPEDVEQLAA